MKTIAQAFLLCTILIACTGTKKISEEKPVNDIVIHDTMQISEKKDKLTVGEGTKVTKTIPVRDMPIMPDEKITVEKQVEVNPPIVIPSPPVVPELVETDENDDYAQEAFDHTVFDTLLKNHVTANGNVSYAGFAKDKGKLRDYIASLGNNMPNKNANTQEKLAYWMNAYNAMTVDLILRNMPLESIKNIKDPWEQRLWKLEDKWYNLDEIEHQILRKMGDARIHFGINCASFSCPPLLNEAFNAVDVDKQLDFLAKRFINDPSRNTINKESIEISKIFTWFSKDFKKDGSVIDFLNRYSNTSIDTNARVRYKDYNWELNK
ncbi:hypothetical protein ULMS_08400 [Patiriisocius marinistellae]|uniref:DUF547 domain-containing protein n=1 Tax=Patiriisocius marinistellae TaxID=2494560 RepID=A0A5J4FW02_9FLAO|nr:DUF547 domain-containing protein [Patiriisocius marinistellae]GEQ85332.1 hypothetical protein ULMS_08400 [Patiriisocius marinistellae]